MVKQAQAMISGRTWKRLAPIWLSLPTKLIYNALAAWPLLSMLRING